MTIRRTGMMTFRLTASQVLPIDRERAFRFFEDPGNLFSITPEWLDFRMIDPGRTDVHENAEFEYTIRWLGIRMPWKSRIIAYHPPERFTDIQIKGPYRSWTHRHTLIPLAGGTIMDDEVTYEIPFPALFLHRLLIMKHLRDIFSYRAMKVEDWALKQQVKT